MLKMNKNNESSKNMIENFKFASFTKLKIIGQKRKSRHSKL